MTMAAVGVAGVAGALALAALLSVSDAPNAAAALLAMVGAGMSGRRRHVRWAGVARIFLVWVLTVPACGLVAAGAFEVLRRLP
jgi:phosphate/sulfate permease